MNRGKMTAAVLLAMLLTLFVLCACADDIIVSSATLDLDRLPQVQAREDSHILVAYFSTNDTIRAVAMAAADVLEGDLFEIVPAESYSEEDLNYRMPGNRAGEEQRRNARPEIVFLPEHMEQYDTILLGYPIWGGHAPNILYTFLESIGPKHVTILPFCTSNMTGPGTSAVNMQTVTDASVTWLPAERIANHATEDDLRAWAQSLVTKVTDVKESGEMQLKIGDTEVSVVWEDNDAVRELKRMAAEQQLSVEMSMYGGFEQVGPLGVSLPRDDHQITTVSGDIVLYSGNQIVIFYGSNAWAYTRLGHIEDQTPSDMRKLLGDRDVTITLCMDGQ